MRLSTLFLWAVVLTTLVGIPRTEGATFTFRDGLDGYMGTHDLEIREADPDLNRGGEGSMSVDQEDDAINGTLVDLPTNGLLRFENLFAGDGGPIPADSTINSAELTIYVTNESAGGTTLSFNRMLREWDEDTSTWNSLMAPLELDGTDAVADPDDVISPANISDTFASVDVTESVEAWNAGEPNFGWLLTIDSTNGLDYITSEGTPEEQRPQLTIDFTPPMLDPDLDGDGDVDADDFLILSSNMYAHLDGTEVSFEDGDLDFDQDVDLFDFRQFKTGFPGAAAAALGVPEPGTWGLLAAGLAGVLLGRRRFHRNDKS